MLFWAPIPLLVIVPPFNFPMSSKMITQFSNFPALEHTPSYWVFRYSEGKYLQHCKRKMNSCCYSRMKRGRQWKETIVGEERIFRCSEMGSYLFLSGIASLVSLHVGISQRSVWLPKSFFLFFPYCENISLLRKSLKIRVNAIFSPQYFFQL